MRLTFLAIVMWCSSANAGVILGVLYNQPLGGATSEPNLVFPELVTGNHKWVLPGIGVDDVGKVFTASAATVGDYPQLDWDELSYLMTYDKQTTFTFGERNQTFAWKPTQMYSNRFTIPNWEAGFTPPEIYFRSIDRIELEIAILSFETQDNVYNTVFRWSIYGEPTSAPEPSTPLLCALGGVLLCGPLGYRRARCGSGAK